MGTALPGNAEVVVLCRPASNPGQDCVHAGFGRYVLEMWNSQAGTVSAQFSEDSGATWRDIKTAAMALTTTVANEFTCIVAPFRDWRVIWTNGVTPQTVFRPNQYATPGTAPLS